MRKQFSLILLSFFILSVCSAQKSVTGKVANPTGSQCENELGNTASALTYLNKIRTEPALPCRIILLQNFLVQIKMKYSRQ